MFLPIRENIFIFHLQKTVKNALKRKSTNEHGTILKDSKKPEISEKRAVKPLIFRQSGLLKSNDCGSVHLQSFRRQIQLTFTTNKNMTIMQRRGLRPDISKVYSHLTGNILLPAIFLPVFLPPHILSISHLLSHVHFINTCPISTYHSLFYGKFILEPACFWHVRIFFYPYRLLLFLTAFIGLKIVLVYAIIILVK